MFTLFVLFIKYFVENPSGIIVKVLDCGLEVTQFEPQSKYYGDFRVNTLGESMTLLSNLDMG